MHVYYNHIYVLRDVLFFILSHERVQQLLLNEATLMP